MRAHFPSLILAGMAAIAAPPVGAQAAFEEGIAPSDSSALVGDARERQLRFERYRESRIPTSMNADRASCDERIGRICIWFGEDERDFPPEPIETALARRELIAELAAASERIADPWIVGQLVHYLAEEGSLQDAEAVARRCGLADGWWCSALLGYALHLQDDFVGAEAAFRSSVADVPPEEEGRWRTPRVLLTAGALRELDQLSPAEQEERWEIFWRLSDPLLLVEGNDRYTEHYARLVEAVNQERAENPYGLQWESDMEEALVRYGRNTGWSRVREAPAGLGSGGFQLNDTRRVVGHHHPDSRGYLFPESFLAAPADIAPESWITAPREARSWYAAPYAPDFRGLETQVARFRRGDEMLIVGAYRPAPAAQDPLAAYAPPPPEDERPDPFASRSAPPAPPPSQDALDVRGPVRTGLFLIPESPGEAVSVEGAEPAGVLTLHAPPGRYVSSLELFEPQAGRAWRARQGINQSELTRGLVAVSDLMILREDAPLPEDLDEAIPLARPGIRVARDERFTVVWEVYGLDVEEEVRVTLGFTSGRPGFLTRVGEFLGVLEPENPVEVTFTDVVPDEIETLFRAVTLSLPDLEPGDYTLHLRLELPGREPAINSRPITVEG